MNRVRSDELRSPSPAKDQPAHGSAARSLFCAAMAAHFRQTCPTMSENKAAALADQTLAEYLKEIGAEFGDPAYGWNEFDAVAVAEEFETDHWEAV
jgi:hypothetical protein